MDSKPFKRVEVVQTYGKKKTAIAIATCKRVPYGTGKITLNKIPLELIEPETLRYKVHEPVLVLGKERFEDLKIKVRVTGGGHVSQIYAIRQAIAKAVVAFYQKYVDEASKTFIKDTFLQFDKTLLIKDPRRTEAKKFGGKGARARFQKSYR